MSDTTPADPERRLDRILQPDFLEGLEDRTTAELRKMRDECRLEENGISYARRVVQGRIDMLRAEVARRSRKGGDNGSTLLGELPDVLSDVVGTSRSPVQRRAAADLIPMAVHYDRREVDNVASEPAVGDLRSRPVEELAALGEELTEREAELSRVRQQLFIRIDTLQDQLVERYKRGEANVREVLGG